VHGGLLRAKLVRDSGCMIKLIPKDIVVVGIGGHSEFEKGGFGGAYWYVSMDF